MFQDMAVVITDFCL